MTFRLRHSKLGVRCVVVRDGVGQKMKLSNLGIIENVRKTVEIKNPCMSCNLSWLCIPYGGTCRKSRFFRWIKGMNMVR